MSTIRTTLNLNTHARNGTEYEVEIEASYVFRRGYKATRTDPSEPDSIEITDLMVFDRLEHINCPAPWLWELLQDDAELLALCLQDAIERREDAAEARAEYLAEMKEQF